MGSSKQTQTKDPYAPAKPLLQQSANIVDDYLKNPNSTAVYDGPRTVDQSQYTKDGLNALANNGGMTGAKNYYTKALNGDFYDPNGEYVQGLQKAVQSAVMPGVNSTFAKSGMMGSTLHQGVLGRALTDGMAAPLFQNYQNERGIQDRAAAALPALYGADAQAKLQAGQISEGYDKQKIAADWQKWQEQQDAPLKALQKTYPYTSNIAGQGGTTTSTTSQSPWATAAGLGMAGLGLATGMGPAMGGLGMMGGMGGLFGGQPTSASNPWSYNMPNKNISGWGW